MPVSTRTVPLPMTPSTETAMGVALHSGTPGRDAGLAASLMKAKPRVRSTDMPRCTPSRVTM